MTYPTAFAQPKKLMSGRIVIVDDVEDNCIILSRNLTRAGFETETLTDGVSAISMVSTSPPDLILLDWMMPKLSGLDVLHAVREHFDANSLPVIMCTARDEASSIGEAIEAGANDYIQKPINMPIVIARVSAQLERRAALQALSEANRDLEETLARRTRALMEKGERTGSPTEDRTTALNEIQRLAAWLRTENAGVDTRLRGICADSIVTAARLLAAS